MTSPGYVSSEEQNAFFIPTDDGVSSGQIAPPSTPVATARQRESISEQTTFFIPTGDEVLPGQIAPPSTPVASARQRESIAEQTTFFIPTGDEVLPGQIAPPSTPVASARQRESIAEQTTFFIPTGDEVLPGQIAPPSTPRGIPVQGEEQPSARDHYYVPTTSGVDVRPLAPISIPKMAQELLAAVSNPSEHASQPLPQSSPTITPSPSLTLSTLPRSSPTLLSSTPPLPSSSPSLRNSNTSSASSMTPSPTIILDVNDITFLPSSPMSHSRPSVAIIRPDESAEDDCILQTEMIHDLDAASTRQQIATVAQTTPAAARYVSSTPSHRSTINACTRVAISIVSAAFRIPPQHR